MFTGSSKNKPKSHSITNFFARSTSGNNTTKLSAQSSDARVLKSRPKTSSSKGLTRSDVVITAVRSNSKAMGATTKSVTSSQTYATSTPSWMSQPKNAFDEVDFDDLDDVFDDLADEAFFANPPAKPTISISKTPSIVHSTSSHSQAKHIPKKSSPTLIPGQPNRTRILPWEKKTPENAPLRQNSLVEPDRIAGVELARRLGSMPQLSKSRTQSPSAALAMAKQAAAQMRSSKDSSDNSIVLSEEQKGVIKLVMSGTSLFFTGAAGTGKSVLLREIISSLGKKFRAENIAVTASTGLAALNIKGETLHRFAGIGLGNAPASHLIRKIKSRQEPSNRWKQCRVLIIDEISMVDGALLDKLDIIAREIRKTPHMPFGGIQLICTGDFFQLPPVDNKNNFSKTSKVSFAFESKVWEQVMKNTIVLTQVFRQQGDNKLIQMLNAMRMGSLTPAMCKELSCLSREVRYDDGIEPTELYPTRREVEMANKRRLESLRGILHVYKARDSVNDTNLLDTGMSRADALKLLDNTLGLKELLLRHDSQVMLIRNKTDTLVNGSLGLVIAFLTPSEYSALILENINGGDFDTLARNIEANRNPNDMNKPETLSSIGTITHESNSIDTLFPVVRFAGESIPVQIEPVDFDITAPNRKTVASRMQFPLILSWAMSVHKSQGQTLDRVKVNLYRTFESGQAYVAVSRATATERLQVTNFNPSKVMAHPKVIAFYNSLKSISASTRQSTTMYDEIDLTQNDDEDDDFGYF